jgi:hypothetical protein
MLRAPRTAVHASEMTTADATRDGRHDFDFLFGDWTVENRRLDHPVDPACRHWRTFRASVHVQPIFGGLGHHDLFSSTTETPHGPWQGFTLRLYDPDDQQWRIWWTSTEAPGRLDPVMTGSFRDGTGTFFGNDTVEGTALGCRFLWQQPGPGQAQWSQAFRFSPDQAWITNWVMELTRVRA